MTVQPFRSAFWVMVLGLGLCVCLLTVEPRQSAPPLVLSTVGAPVIPDLVDSQPPSPVVDGTAEQTSSTVAASVEVVEPDPEVEALSSDGSVAEVGAVEPDPPPHPVREVLDQTGERPGWSISQVTDRAPTVPRFEELPPPPSAVIETVDGPASPWRAPDQAVLAELDVLTNQVCELADAVREMRDRQTDVSVSIEGLLAQKSPPPVPNLLQCEAQVFYVPPQGAPEWRSVLALDFEGRDDTRGVLWGHTTMPPVQIAASLAERGAVTVRERQFPVRRLVAMPVDLSGRLAPRIVEARGGEVREQLPAEPWRGEATIQWDAISADRVLISVGTDRGSPGGTSRWEQFESQLGEAIVLIHALRDGQSTANAGVGRQQGSVVLVMTMKAPPSLSDGDQ